jgi:hypothetical protein
MKTFDTVAKLKLAKLKEGQFVETGGYYAKGDAGAARYLIVTPQSFDGYGDHELANGNIAVLQKTIYLPASQYGVVPTGIVNILALKALITESTLLGWDVQFSAGTYDFNGQNVYDGGLVRGQDAGSMRFIGGVGSTTIFESIGSAHFSDVILSRGIHYKDCVQPIYMSGVVNELDIQGCEFSGNRRSIYHNDSAAGAEMKSALIKGNYFHDHQEDEFIGCILLHRAPISRNVTVEQNTFERITIPNGGAGTVLLCQAGVDTSTALDTYSNFKFNGNRITDCGRVATDFTEGADAVHFGCVFIGLDCEQHNNVIYDNHWFEPLYTKGNGNSQVSNRLRNNQFSGLSMKVVATPSNVSKECIQALNVITGECNIRAAVRMFGAGESIDNIIDITTRFSTTAGDADYKSQGALAFQTTRSATVGKLKVTGDFKAPKGVQMNTAGDLELDFTLDSETNGLLITKSPDGNLNTVAVRGKISCKEQAFNVNWAKVIDTSGLEVICNYSLGNSMFYYSQVKTILDNMSLHVTDVDGDGLAIATPIGLFAKDGQPTNQSSHLTSIDNLTFTTDRNFTQVTLFNADAGWLSPDGCKVKISDSAIDMNGKTGNSLMRSNSNMKIFSAQGVEVDGTLARTLNGGGVTVGKVLINQNLMDYVATDNLAGHTNATATTSRVGNNKTV